MLIGAPHSTTLARYGVRRERCQVAGGRAAARWRPAARAEERLTAAQKVKSSSECDTPLSKRVAEEARRAPADLFAPSVRSVSDRRRGARAVRA
jgi:hypothetical protein